MSGQLVEQWPIKTLDELINEGLITLGRGKIISRKDLAATPGTFPVYSSAKKNQGKFGEYGLYMFDEELITWSIDGGGRLFHRKKHKFSVTNVGGTLRINDTSRLDYKFLYYCLTLLHSKINFDWVKKAHPSIIRKLYNEIPIPTIEEQNRIVKIFDEIFGNIDQSINNLNLELINTREIFPNFLGSIFENLDSGEPMSIGSIGSVFDGPHATPKTIESGPVFLGLKNLESGGLNLSKTRHVSEEDYIKWTRRIVPQTDDVVFSYETKLGAAAIIPENLVCCLGRRMGLVRIKKDIIYPRFFLYQYLSPTYQMYLSKFFIRGATVDRISIKNFPSYIMQVPPLSMQIEIIRRLDDVESATRKMEQIIITKLANLSEIKHSLLQEVFNGTLRIAEGLAGQS